MTQPNHRLCSCVICHTQTTVQSINAHFDKHIRNTKTCPTCGATHEHVGTFCSKRCANSRPRSVESSIAKSQRLKGKPNPRKGTHTCIYTPITWCIECGKAIPYKIGRRKPKTCSQTCKCSVLSAAGKKSASLRVTRSRDEIALYNLCNNYYAQVTHNIPMFNGWDADIIIHDTKTAILWNGPWHYRAMPGLTHSLAQVQNRDAIKINEIQSAGWNVIVFNDCDWTPDTAFEHITAWSRTVRSRI